MRCNTVRENLNALADNEATQLMRLRLRRHVAHCPSCAAELADIEGLGGEALRWHEVTAPVALRDRVMGSLPQELVLQTNSFKPNRPGWRGLLVRWRFAGGLAGLLLLHWIVVGQLDAQRATLLASPQQAATFAASPTSESESVANALAWRTEMLALMLENNQNTPRTDLEERNHEPQPTRVPKRTSANTRSGQTC